MKKIRGVQFKWVFRLGNQYLGFFFPPKWFRDRMMSGYFSSAWYLSRNLPTGRGFTQYAFHLQQDASSALSLSIYTLLCAWCRRCYDYPVLKSLPPLDFRQFSQSTLTCMFCNVQVPSVDPGRVGAVIGDAVAVAVMGFIESMAVCKTYADKHNYSVSSNRELVALVDTLLHSIPFKGGIL